MEFKSAQIEKITLKIDGAEYSLRQPLVGDLRRLSKMGDLAPEKMMEETIDFIVSMGIPEDVINKLSMATLVELFNYISTPKKSH